MYTGQMDIMSTLLYVIMGLVASFCVGTAKRNKGKITLTQRLVFPKRYLPYAVFVALFTCFAVFRKVGVNLGGSDAEVYKMVFLNANDPASPYYYLISEPLFRFYCQFIRIFTDDYKVFFVVTYGLITISYVLFVEKYCPKDVTFTPFVLLLFLYLKSFCTMRTSMAVAVFLLGLVCMDKNRIVSLILMVATVFIHRMSVAYAIFPIFYWLFRSFIQRTEGVKLASFLFAVGYCGVIAARALQWIIIEFGLFSGTDAWYLQQSRGSSLIFSFPMYFAQLVLMIALVMLGATVEKSSKYYWVKVFCCFDIVVMPATLVLGFWRANEYMYVARLTMWAMLIHVGEKLFPNYVWRLLRYNDQQLSEWKAESLRRFYRVCVMCVFLAWLMFRICSEWDELKIMPYVFDFAS